MEGVDIMEERQVTKEFLAEQRKHYKLSQDRASKLIDVDIRTLQHWEAGSYKTPTYLPRVIESIIRELDEDGLYWDALCDEINWTDRYTNIECDSLKVAIDKTTNFIADYQHERESESHRGLINSFTFYVTYQLKNYDGLVIRELTDEYNGYIDEYGFNFE